MTRFDPSLKVRRLVVERGTKRVYDERFHAGVNIIRGDNSSGKSTILNLLFYGLGGDVSDWSPVALLCSRVMVEVEVSGKVATLAREVIARGTQPMDVFGGDLDDAAEAPQSEWSRYPYRRSESRESFSQVLFRLLGIPEAGNEVSGNVTIHQLLRLMYADQLSPIGTLFKFEQFDPPLLRDQVGRLVFGAFENELYANELRIRDLDKEFMSVSGELSSVAALLGQADRTPTPDWLRGERARIEADREKVAGAIATAEQALFQSAKSDELTLSVQRAAYARVQQLQTDISTAQQTLDGLAFEIADSGAFLRDLESKLQALQDSAETTNLFGRVRFQYCPACYSVVEPDQPVHACHLCKTPFDSDRGRVRVVTLINDTARQIRQSRELQREREEERVRLQGVLAKLVDQWSQASRELRDAQQRPSSAAAANLRDLQRQAGYLERELEELASKARLSELLEGLIQRKAALTAEIEALRARNLLISRSVSARLSVAYAEVEAEILKLLRDDLPREEAFIKSRSVQFDFSSNSLSVDGQSYFSASSRVILRNSFFVGLLAAATIDRSFRHLRYCMLDTIEDKGMQDERSHNFQRLIVAISERATCEHQIIFGTSMIAPDLENPSYTVGPYYTLEHKTIAIHEAIT